MNAYQFRGRRHEVLSKSEIQVRNVQCGQSLTTSAATRLWVALAALLFTTAAAHSQNYTLDFLSTEGGGGTSTSGVYTVSSNVGEAVAAAPEDGSFSVSIGFWSISAAVSPPFLFATSVGGGVTVKWAKPASGFLLEEGATLAPPPGTPWTPVPVENYQTNATHIFLIVPATAGNKFYRLRKP